MIIIYQSAFLIAQNYDLKWTMSFETEENDKLSIAIKDQYNRILMIGTSNNPDNDSDDVLLVKTESDGQLIWSRKFGGSGQEIGAYAIETEGGYLIGCTSNSNDGEVSDNLGNSDFWVFHIDYDGNLIWENNYGGSDQDRLETMSKNDKGYILAGRTLSSDIDVSLNNGYYDAWVLQIDSSGNILWEKSVGGSQFDILSSCVITNNGKLILLGTTNSEEVIIDSNGSLDVWLVCFDPDGNLLWHKTYGGSSFDSPSSNSLITTNDGNISFCISSESSDGIFNSSNGNFDGWLLKVDQNGNIIWKSNFGYEFYDEPKSLIETQNNTIYVFGHRDDESAGVGTRLDYWVVSFNKDGAQTNDIQFSASINDYASSIFLLNSSIYLAGESHSNFWLGNLCVDEPSNTNDMHNLLEIYPNPINDILYIKGGTMNTFVEIRNNAGVLVESIIDFNDHINVPHLISGLYYLTIKSKHNRTLKTMKVFKR